MSNKGEHKILIVDDEPDILEFIGYNLSREGFSIFKVDNGQEALRMAKKLVPNLILLDVMMPEMDGIETCEKLRSIPELNKTLIAFLTARGEDYSQIAGFDAGGDDYITKPIKPKVLVSRIKALLKRTTQIIQDDETPVSLEVKNAGLLIDKEKYIIHADGKELFLPKKEFELLVLLVSKPGKVFNREEIFSKVWGDDIIVGDRTIDVHIRKLREKIGEKYIKTIKGVGYKFSD